jgi:hypothetical protein
MIRIRQPNDDVLVINAGRAQELLGFLLLALGLGGLGWGVYGVLALKGPAAAPALVGLLCAAIGVELFLRQDRWIFDRRSRILFLRFPFKGARGMSFDELSGAKLIAREAGSCDLELELKGSGKLFLGRGAEAEVRALARKIAVFAGLPEPQ